MEKCVGSDYMQSKNDSKTHENSTCTNCCLSNNTEKSKCKGCCKIPRVRKKIVSQERSPGRSDPIENVTSKKTRKHISGSKLNVLNKHVTESSRQSVQKKTKIIQRNVPDRLGKYVSYSVRSETKLLLSDCKLETKPLSNECSNESESHSLGEHSKMKFTFDGYTETKLALLGNECLSNNEAVSLSNSFESDLETKNIFENFFDDCLGSTSKEKDVSSQENVNLEGNSNLLSLNSEPVGKFNSLLETLENFEKDTKAKCEKTPVKKKQETSPPPTPVKIKDHSNYYRSHKNIRHVCTYCQKIFKSNGKLNSHVYSHTGERPFDCNHCGKAFSSKFKLVRHLLIHSEIRKFVCQICNRTFLRNDHLKNHYKVHDPQKKMYKCPKENCDKEYSSIMSHKKHMAYHNVEDGDLKCLICNVKYETKEEVLFHLKSHSGSRLFKSQSDKKFKCEFCDRLFLTRKDVTRHLVVHTGERDFLCQFCPQRFGRKDHLVRHIKKSHGNEDLSVKSEVEVKTAKEDCKKLDEGKPKNNEKVVKKYPTKDNSSSAECTTPSVPSTHSTTKETNTQTEESRNKTHIVITVQGKTMKSPMQTRKRNVSDSAGKKKSFQKNEMLVPKKKQVPFTKSKNSTTQILLQNIPNILIIPNNSIILLRNQGSSKTLKDDEEKEKNVQTEPEPSLRPTQNEEPEMFLTPPPTVQNPNTSDNFNINFNYDSNIFPSPSQFLGGFSEGDNFCNFQTDLPSFGSHFEDSDQLNFEMLNHNDLLPRPEVGLNSIPTTNSQLRTDENLLTETSRQIKLLETDMNTSCEKQEKEKSESCEDIEKDFFEDGILNESILNELKNESSGILPTDADVGILSNILNQSNDNCGFELLRNLLTSENPVMSPLPGFNQIFHNSNANSS